MKVSYVVNPYITNIFLKGLLKSIYFLVILFIVFANVLAFATDHTDKTHSKGATTHTYTIISFLQKGPVLVLILERLDSKSQRMLISTSPRIRNLLQDEALSSNYKKIKAVLKGDFNLK